MKNKRTLVVISIVVVLLVVSLVGLYFGAEWLLEQKFRLIPDHIRPPH